MPNVLITPHVGNTPEMAVPLLSARITENVRRWQAGEPLLGPVDPASGTERPATVEAVAASHYGTLGVADGAEPDEVRRAYLDLARQLHPDRWIDASPSEREDADRRMQEVNEAWRVLGNPARRLAYDVERREAGPASPRVAARRGGRPLRLLDRRPVRRGRRRTSICSPGSCGPCRGSLVIVGLGAIFVFTAYATSDDGELPTGERGRRVHPQGRGPGRRGRLRRRRAPSG